MNFIIREEDKYVKFKNLDFGTFFYDSRLSGKVGDHVCQKVQAHGNMTVNAVHINEGYPLLFDPEDAVIPFTNVVITITL